MKTKFNFILGSILTLTFFVFSLTNAIAQEKSKKQLKEEAKLEKQKQMKLLVDSKEFVFVARTAMPQGGRTVQLTTNYTLEFHPDVIKCDLPFFGRAYSGVGYGGIGGMQFEGKPLDLKIEKKKKSYDIAVQVKGDNDSYLLMLSVYFDGTAYLSINSNNRSAISYNGNIEALQKK
jgi:hypothetical protein